METDGSDAGTGSIQKHTDPKNLPEIYEVYPVLSALSATYRPNRERSAGADVSNLSEAHFGQSAEVAATAIGCLREVVGLAKWPFFALGPRLAPITATWRIGYH